MKRSQSEAAFAQACQLIPGGVNSPARAFGGVGGKPIFIARGEGAYLIDLDGNRYLDYVGSWGPLILGHCHPRVVEAVTEAMANGATFGAPDRTRIGTRRADHAADAVDRNGPHGQLRHRSVDERDSPGSRLHRAATCIVKFAGCYHGHVDSLLVSAGSSATTLGVPNSPGVPKGLHRRHAGARVTTTSPP